MSFPRPPRFQSGDAVRTRSQSGWSPLRKAVMLTGCRSGENARQYWLITASPLFFRGNRKRGF